MNAKGLHKEEVGDNNIYCGLGQKVEDLSEELNILSTVMPSAKNDCDIDEGINLHFKFILIKYC